MSAIQPDYQGFNAKQRDNLWRYLRSQVEEIGSEIEISKFAGGQSNPTFIVTDGANSYVVRAKPPGDLLKGAHAIDREYQVLDALGNTDVPVPEVYCYCEDKDVIGSEFYVMEFLEGRIVADPALVGFTPNERTAAYHSFISTLGSLHAVDYKSIGLEGFARAEDFFARQVRTWSRQYRASETEHVKDMEVLIAWLESNLPEDGGGTVSLVHGDFRFENLILHSSNLSVIGVIDWELATLGHPHADLAYHCALLRLPPIQGGMTGIEGLSREDLGIPTEEEYLRKYCRTMGINEVPHWKFCLAFNFFRLAAISQGVKKRSLQGNASSDKADDIGRMVPILAELGRQLATDQM